MKNYFIGDEAKRVVNEILENETPGKGYPLHAGAKGYYVDNDKYVAFDNLTQDCWMEEFDTEKEAKKWLAS